MDTLATVTTLLAIIGGFIYFYLRRLWTYWDRRGCPTVADNVFVGVFKDLLLLRLTVQENIREFYERTKLHRFFGTFIMLRPMVVVRDREIIKEVLLKDFANFSGNGSYVNEDRDPLSGTLINLTGRKWKMMRTKLTHAFTSAKLKYMLETMMEVVNRIQPALEKKLSICEGNNVDLPELLSCVSTDIIASLAFGIDVNSVENPHNEFREIGRRIRKPTFLFSIKIFFLLSMHKLAYLFNIRKADAKTCDFIIDLVKRTVEYREKNNVVRPDLFNLLLQMKNKGRIEGVEEIPGLKTEETGRITLNEMTAQIFLFYQAGSEISSIVATFTLYEMCVNPEIKRKVRYECDEVLAAHGGKISYEALQSMDYTEMVINETLRLRPPVGVMVRQASNACKLPLTDLPLEKGTAVMIPIMGLHMDPEYWPDPEKFDPERFSKEAEAKRPSFVYIPFSDGPRICIGSRFAMLQIKAVILSIVSRYELEISRETPYPLKIDRNYVIPSPLNLGFNVTKRTDANTDI